jgi:hypothetical protein
MKKIFLALTISIIVISGSMATTVPVYHLFEIEKNVDFDHKKVDDIDSLVSPYPANSSFQIGDLPTRRGKFTIYKFLNIFMGESRLGRNKLFHNLLAVKTDRDMNVIDAYHYTLEWEDMPSNNLYKMTAKNISLTNEISVKEFKFKNYEKTLLPHTGYIDNVLAGVKYFN